MKPIVVSLTTRTPKGTKKSTAKVQKSKDGVFVNDILIPNAKSVGNLTLSQISYVVNNEEKAKERERKHRAKLELGRIAKKVEDFSGRSEAKSKRLARKDSLKQTIVTE